MLQLYQEKYFDFNIRHFHEKLGEVEGVEISQDARRLWTWDQAARTAMGYIKELRTS